ncbi:MAG: hypothetical protein U0800_11070 [Isosphaeraceae bacterium]
MSGFDIAGLLPFYLDETDEQIGVLNDALLRLERDPGEAQACRKPDGRAQHRRRLGMLGFDEVKQLTHHLESYSPSRGPAASARPPLDASPRPRRPARDYHRDLRNEGRSRADLSSRRDALIACLEGNNPPETEAAVGPPPRTGPDRRSLPRTGDGPRPGAAGPHAALSAFPGVPALELVARFEPGPLAGI